jgi:hypothetical protein
MKQCLSVSVASKDGWVLVFSDRHCGLLPVASLITHTHTDIHIKHIYIYISVHKTVRPYGSYQRVCDVYASLVAMSNSVCICYTC